MRDELLPPRSRPRRHLISIADLDPRRRRAAARARPHVRALARARREEAADAARPHGRQPLLRVLDAHVVELRARREAALGRRDVDQGVRLGGRQGRVAQGHGAHDRRLRPRRDRHPPRRRSARRSSSPAYTTAHVVNAGDGKHQHPTQALLDLYTIDEELGAIEGLHVAIVGDVLHSRVARSNIQALVLMGAQVTLVGPPPLIPRGIEAMGCEVSLRHRRRSSDADVVYVLRMQRERMLEGANYVPSLREYTARWGVTPDRLRPGQKVMHPGPMNRGVEIDAAVADAADALIERQVRSGPRRPHGRPLRPAHARPGRGQGRRDPGGGVMLALRQNGRQRRRSSFDGARVLDPRGASTRR